MQPSLVSPSVQCNALCRLKEQMELVDVEMQSIIESNVHNIKNNVKNSHDDIDSKA